jgi:hypothetical protein
LFLYYQEKDAAAADALPHKDGRLIAAVLFPFLAFL